jgi:hypothetical protein
MHLTCRPSEEVELKFGGMCLQCPDESSSVVATLATSGRHVFARMSTTLERHVEDIGVQYSKCRPEVTLDSPWYVTGRGRRGYSGSRFPSGISGWTSLWFIFLPLRKSDPFLVVSQYIETVSRQVTKGASGMPLDAGTYARKGEKHE